MIPLLVGAFGLVVGAVVSMPLWIPAVLRMRGRPLPGLKSRVFGVEDEKWTLKNMADIYKFVGHQWIAERPEDAAGVLDAINSVDVTLVRGSIQTSIGLAGEVVTSPHTMIVDIDHSLGVPEASGLAHGLIHCIKWQIEGDPGNNHPDWPDWQVKIEADVIRGRM